MVCKLKFEIKSYILNEITGFTFAVSIRSELDSNARYELTAFRQSNLLEELSVIQKKLQEQLQFPASATDPSNWIYATYVFDILLQIFNELESHEELPITVNEAKKVHNGIRKSVEFGLKPFMLAVGTLVESRLPYIIASTNALIRITSSKYFAVICTRTDQHLVLTDLFSSIFLILTHARDETKTKFEENLRSLKSKIPHADYFKILFLIKGSNQAKTEIATQNIVHKQLMLSLYRKGSFVALSDALLPSITSMDEDEEIMKKRLHCGTVISTIVSQFAQNKPFFHQIIDEIHEHLLRFIRSKKSHQLYFTDVGVQCLNKLYSRQLNHIQTKISDLLLSTFNKLAEPTDLIAGAVVCEPAEFEEAVHLVHLAFCAYGPSNDTVPSEILVPIMPLFIRLHHLMGESTNIQLRNEILDIIVRCLSNREKSELNRIVEWILLENYDDTVKCLHPRLKVENIANGEATSLIFSIAATESTEKSIAENLDLDSFLRPSNSIVNVLKNSNNNMLIYNVFLHLLEMFSKNFAISNKSELLTSSSELLDSEDELKTMIELKFKRKYTIINSLSELILFKPFHCQFAENPHEIISMIDKILNQQINHIESSQRSSEIELSTDYEEILIVILSIVGDFMARVQTEEIKAQLEQTLKKLRSVLKGSQMNSVLRKLDRILSPHVDLQNNEFAAAKEILSELHTEPYIKVYGMMNMIKLVNARDEETCLNGHVVLALAMKLLKEEDSYIFLNCIRLLIALFDVLKGTVLEALISEYHFDIDADSADIDFKLKVGEAIIKVTSGLGEMCFNYKDILINCFLRGAYNRNDEFRTSNMSNLGVILKFLSYQIHHIFEEVRILFINSRLSIIIVSFAY